MQESIVAVCKCVFPAMKNCPLNLYELQVLYNSPDLEILETINDGPGYGANIDGCCHV